MSLYNDVIQSMLPIQESMVQAMERGDLAVAIDAAGQFVSRALMLEDQSNVAFAYEAQAPRCEVLMDVCQSRIVEEPQTINVLKDLTYLWIQLMVAAVEDQQELIDARVKLDARLAEIATHYENAGNADPEVVREIDRLAGYAHPGAMLLPTNQIALTTTDTQMSRFVGHRFRIGTSVIVTDPRMMPTLQQVGITVEGLEQAVRQELQQAGIAYYDTEAAAFAARDHASPLLSVSVVVAGSPGPPFTVSLTTTTRVFQFYQSPDGTEYIEGMAQAINSSMTTRTDMVNLQTHLWRGFHEGMHYFGQFYGLGKATLELRGGRHFAKQVIPSDEMILTDRYEVMMPPLSDGLYVNTARLVDGQMAGVQREAVAEVIAQVLRQSGVRQIEVVSTTDWPDRRHDINQVAESIAQHSCVEIFPEAQAFASPNLSASRVALGVRTWLEPLYYADLVAPAEFHAIPGTTGRSRLLTQQFAQDIQRSMGEDLVHFTSEVTRRFGKR